MIERSSASSGCAFGFGSRFATVEQWFPTQVFTNGTINRQTVPYRRFFQTVVATSW